MECELEPWEMTLQEYAESIYNNPAESLLYKECIITDLKEYEQTLENLLAKRIKPATVVGTGYKNPRKVAIEWLTKCIGEYRAIVEGTAIHSVIRANYDSHIRTAIRKGLILPSPAVK